MDIAIMIEGQNGLTWDHWKRVLDLAQELDFNGVWRSDHFTNPNPPDLPSLELWTSLTYAASATRRIEFGPLVAPVTFRHPSITARVAAAIDDLSGGRLVLGMGAGWQDREHHNFGVPFPPTATRFEMLDEYIQVVTLLLRSDEPVTFDGRYYTLHDAILLPRPRRRMPILIGGNGEKRTMPLAARYADEWNMVYPNPVRAKNLNERMDGLLRDAGRAAESLKRSAMVGTLFARDEDALRKKLEGRPFTAEEAFQRGLIAGTPDMWIDQLRQYADAGLSRVMLQWLDFDSLDDLRIIAEQVMPAMASGPLP